MLVSVDPLQFEHPYYTPYQYAGNDPVTKIDQLGISPEGPPETKERVINSHKAEKGAAESNVSKIHYQQNLKLTKGINLLRFLLLTLIMDFCNKGIRVIQRKMLHRYN